MKLEFELIKPDENAIRIIPDFCDLLIYEFRNDLVNSIRIDEEKYSMLEDRILNASFIKWKDKPAEIDIYKFLRFISNNTILESRRNNSYIICIDPTVIIPGTRNKLEQVVRFLDKGNERMSPLNSFNVVARTYRKKIKQYWKSYISIRLGIINVKCTIKVR